MVTIVTTETTGEVQGRAREEQQGSRPDTSRAPRYVSFLFFIYQTSIYI